jgi:ABC-type sugar transport system permease subunit
MQKKVLKYVGIALGLLAGLPLIVSPFIYKIMVANVATSENVKLFAELDGFKILVKDFNPFWITLIGILVIVAVSVAALLLVVSILDDLKVTKLQKVEKFLATILILVGMIALISVIINQFANSNYESTELAGKKITSGSGLTSNIFGWLFSAFAIVGGMIARANTSTAKKGKKRK